MRAAWAALGGMNWVSVAAAAVLPPSLRNSRLVRIDSGIYDAFPVLKLRLQFLLDFFIAMQASPVDQVEKKHADQTKSCYCKIGIEIPQIWDNYRANVGQLLDLGEYLLVGQPKDRSTNKKTQQSRDQIVKFSFAAPGGAGAWSESGDGHTDPEDQAAYQISSDISLRNARECNQSKTAQGEQASHSDDQGSHHELQYCHVRQAEYVHDFVVACQSGLVQ
jgi:hypothetical protein